MHKYLVIFFCLTMICACKSDKSSISDTLKETPSNQHLNRSKESLKERVENGSLNKRAPLIMSGALDSQLASNADITLIDVRTPGEISEGKIAKALEIDFRASNLSKK